MKKYIWHVESKFILPPAKFLLTIVNIFNYIDNIVTKNRSVIPLDLNIMLGPYKFELQATVDHHGKYLNCGHYTASINCKTFYCNDANITERNINDRYNSSTVYIILYKLTI